MVTVHALDLDFFPDEGKRLGARVSERSALRVVEESGVGHDLLLAVSADGSRLEADFLRPESGELHELDLRTLDRFDLGDWLGGLVGLVAARGCARDLVARRERYARGDQHETCADRAQLPPGLTVDARPAHSPRLPGEAFSPSTLGGLAPASAVCSGRAVPTPRSGAFPNRRERSVATAGGEGVSVAGSGCGPAPKRR